MGIQSNEQVLHDRINLVHLVRRLDKAIAITDWEQESGLSAQVKTLGVLEKLKHARRLWQDAGTYDDIQDSASFHARHDDLRRTLDRLESTMLNINERLSSPPTRPPALLPSIPLPPPAARGLEPSRTLPTSAVIRVEESNSAQPELDLLLGSADDLQRDSSPLAPDPVDPIFLPSRTQTTDAPLPLSSGSQRQPQIQEPAFLQNSAKLHDEMSAQLAQMARQLKSNASYFSESLAKDQAAMAIADEKIGSNLDMMTKERTRLRDHRGKSMGTTCLTITSVVVVLISFIVMFFIIRFTRR